MSITLPAEPFEWHEQIELLGQAALVGSVEFLEECVSHNAPNEYYLSELKISNAEIGNLLHMALVENRTRFFKKVVELLNPKVTQQLMLKQTSTLYENPLHLAAVKGDVEDVKLILEFCSSQPSSKPWLQRDSLGRTPCHAAVDCNKEECGLEILQMDMEQLSRVVDYWGNGLFYLAVYRGLLEVALKILESSPSFTSAGYENVSPLHILPRETDRQDIFKLLLKRAPHLVEHVSDRGMNILHAWAQWGKVWPFEYLIQNCNDIIPNISRLVVNFMSATDRDFGVNPFHILAKYAPNEEDAVTIMKILINTYRQESPPQSSGDLLPPPWLARAKNGDTPLDNCLENKYQSMAIHLLLEEKDAFLENLGSILVEAITKGCAEVAKHILNSVDTDQWTELKDHDHNNGLHFAPYCTEEFLEFIVDGNPKLLEGITKDGCTILHMWAQIGYVWPFKYIIQRHEVNHLEWNRKMLLPLFQRRDKDGSTIFHYAMLSQQKKTNDIVQLLVNAFKELYSSWKSIPVEGLPWFQYNIYGEAALHEAIRNHHQDAAQTILSQLGGKDIHELLDIYKPKYRTLFLAMEKSCYQVAKDIVANLRKRDRTPYLENLSDGKNILHLAPSCTDKEFGKWLVAQAPEFILKPNNGGKTPLDEASEVGADWIIRAFIDCYPGRFKDHCVKCKDSPLHHINLPNITSYEDFLAIPHMKNLVNIQDSNGATPLHNAIRKKNIHLTEVLLNIEDVLLDIKDNDNQTARFLLRKICNEDQEWKNMCEDNGFDLSMKLTYLQRKTNSIDTRNTLSVVAALLATITFTAGFTLPGGFNQDTGEAILAKKAAFLVFLISDTIALCSSMFVLTCLIWSMVYDPNKAMLLIDRSMKLLMLSLYSTMVAFMCGVFIVISQKSLWAAILVIVICSLLGLSAKRSLLYTLVDKLIPLPTLDYKDQLSHCRLEMGKLCSCRGESSCLKCS